MTTMTMHLSPTGFETRTARQYYRDHAKRLRDAVVVAREGMRGIRNGITAPHRWKSRNAKRGFIR